MCVAAGIPGDFDVALISWKPDYEAFHYRQLCKVSRMTARILDLEREMPNLRAFAFRRWQDAGNACKDSATDPRSRTTEVDAFWDWALLELLVQSGLRIEEASEFHYARHP